MKTKEMVLIGTYDNGHALRCRKCGRTLLNPGYHKQSTRCCDILQKWYEYDYRDVAAILGADGRWRIHLLTPDGAPAREFERFNAGRGYGSARAAKRAWDRTKDD